MRFERITGPVTICQCLVCDRQGPGGDTAYTSASTGETRTPEDWYVDADNLGVYCSTCAAKLVQDDPTRSVSTFYANTTGTEVDPERL
jgi:hypothetical protein